MISAAVRRPVAVLRNVLTDDACVEVPERYEGDQAAADADSAIFRLRDVLFEHAVFGVDVRDGRQQAAASTGQPDIIGEAAGGVLSHSAPFKREQGRRCGDAAAAPDGRAGLDDAVSDGGAAAEHEDIAPDGSEELIPLFRFVERGAVAQRQALDDDGGLELDGLRWLHLQEPGNRLQA